MTICELRQYKELNQKILTVLYAFCIACVYILHYRWVGMTTLKLSLRVRSHGLLVYRLCLLPDTPIIFDNLIAQTKDDKGEVHCDRACIIGIDGGGPWTTKDNPSAIKLQGQEGVIIANRFKNKDFTPFMASGIYVEDKYYFFLRGDDDVVYARRGGEAVTLQATKTAVIITHCPVGSQQGFTNKGVNVIAEYLLLLDM